MPPEPVYPAHRPPDRPTANPLSALRTAVVVAKVGNYDSHPQWGTNHADIVYEEIINANVSRFAMVFQSQTADRWGRSVAVAARTSTCSARSTRPIFAWAGGNGTVTAEVNNSDLVTSARASVPGSCFRTKDDKPSEFTLFFNVNKVWDAAARGRAASRRSSSSTAPATTPGGRRRLGRRAR